MEPRARRGGRSGVARACENLPTGCEGVRLAPHDAGSRCLPSCETPAGESVREPPEPAPCEIQRSAAAALARGESPSYLDELPGERPRGSGGRYWARTSDPQLVELVLSQ